MQGSFSKWSELLAGEYISLSTEVAFILSALRLGDLHPN